VLEQAADAAPNTFRGALLGLAKQDSQLCEDLLDRIEVGAVRRQEDEPRVDGADSPADRSPFVGAEIVHHHDIAGLQCRHQHLLDISAEALAVDRPIDDAGRDDPIVPECGKEGHRTPMAVWNLSPERDPTSPPAMGTGHVGLCPRLIDEDETRRIDFKLMPLPPGAAASDVRTILFGREYGFF
jgi:hypothetical protein